MEVIISTKPILNDFRASIDKLNGTTLIVYKMLLNCDKDLHAQLNIEHVPSNAETDASLLELEKMGLIKINRGAKNGD